jgi:hypothetical protein
MEVTSFEALCLSFPSPQGPTTVLTIYRPGSAPITAKFFEEFASVLESIVTRNSQLVILGDFNIHLEESTESSTSQFLELLKQFGLVQHVKEITHCQGGILDLIITTDDTTVHELHVQPPIISDHSLINFILPTLHSLPFHTIRMVRGWKSLDYMAFSRAIQDSKLSLEHSHLDALSVDDLFNLTLQQ